jgi:outer membrane protein assembly factor BamD (BamD/ComL family)
MGGRLYARLVSGARLGAVDELRMEAELLDGARLALSRGALQEARLLLGRYSAQFERGVLRPERDVLGIELEMRTGSQRAAASHAASFLARYPLHPLRERVRELVANASQRAATAAE